MAKANPKFLMNLLDKVAEGKPVTYVKKSFHGELTIQLEIRKNIFRFFHAGTMILRIDLHNREILGVGGWSQTDARYINATLTHFGMNNFASVHAEKESIVLVDRSNPDRYRLINYFDVWGSKKDGWEVNNLCTEKEELEIIRYATNRDLLQALKDCGFIRPGVRINQIWFDTANPEMMEFREQKTDRPIGRLELIQ
jgi:hypothetical protein